MKAPWYMKSNKEGTEVSFHWLWVCFQATKMFIRWLFVNKKDTPK